MAEMINRQNYEVYLIDYLEGTLSPALQAEVQAFLQRNPDIEQELDGLASMRIDVPEVAYEQQAELRMVSHPEVGDMPELDYLCIAQLEGDLTLHESERLQQLEQQYPEATRTAQQAIALTKLQPDMQCVYAHKSQLKRVALPISARRIWTAAATAAAAAIIIGLFTIGNNTTPTTSNVSAPIAQSETVQPNSTEITEQEEVTDTPVAEQTAVAPQEARPTTKPQPRTKAQEQTQISPETTAEPMQTIQPRMNARVEQAIPIELLPNERETMLAALFPTNTVKTIQVETPYYNDMHQALPRRMLSAAQTGLQRVGRVLRIKGEVKRDDDGKITAFTIENEHLAIVIPVQKEAKQ